MRTTAKSRVGWFLLFLCMMSGAAYAVALRQPANPVLGLAVMWSPAVAALLASVATRRSLREIGFWPPRLKWLGIGWLLPVAFAFAAYGAVWLSGIGGVPSATFLQRARFTLHMPTQPDAQVIVAAFCYIGVLGVIPGLIGALGEEIGWRGFLVPELARGVGFRLACLGSGAVWLVWHLPGFFFGAYHLPDTPRAYQLGCFAVLVMSNAVVLAWLRMRSGSIWPPAIAHAAHNALIQAFFERITAERSHTHWFTSEFGIALVPFTAAVAVWLWSRKDVPSPTEVRRLSDTAANSLA